MTCLIMSASLFLYSTERDHFEQVKIKHPKYVELPLLNVIVVSAVTLQT